MKAALVIMAAGLGSRYGGVKQIAGVGPNGEILMQYSVFDAVRAGFDKVVFIITHEIYDGLHELFDEKLRARGVEVRYVFQDFSSVPSFYKIPDGRVKPFGTAHAVLCARDAVTEPFAVINADDYYGAEAFGTIFNELVALPETGRATMVGYRLKNTVSANGTVTRGICGEKDGLLTAVRETYKISVFPDGSIRDTYNVPEGELLDPEAPVSMNFWGFAPSIFAEDEAYFERFLRSLGQDDIKSECLLPMLVDELIKAGRMSVSVLHTDARWFGMTYKEDRPTVQEEIKKLHDAGVYPPVLFK
ncbi:MAG: hypothetical protein ILP09_07600 [Oscillospiraceae bacterium]|nr:hypothetical protein [Oscillospiraceae bacterium]